MSDSPFELQRLVTVGTFSTPWEAQIAKARLAAEGVHSLIADEHLMRMVALANATGGIQLKVREPDAATAAEVLLRLAPLPDIYLVGHDAAGSSEAGGSALAGEPGSRCPSCGSDDLQLERSSRLMLGVLPVANMGYRCGECGTLWKPDEVGTERGADTGLTAPPAVATAGDEPRTPYDDDAPLATVARFHTPWEAHLARTVLESEGVRCCVLEQRLPAVHLLSAEPTAFNRLEVRGCDAARAVEILARAWNYPSLVDAADSDPEDGSAAD